MKPSRVGYFCIIPTLWLKKPRNTGYFVSTIILSDLKKFGDVIDELIKVLHSGGINHIKVKTLNKSVVKQLVDNGFEVEARLNDESNDLSITYIVRRNTV